MQRQSHLDAAAGGRAEAVEDPTADIPRLTSGDLPLIVPSPAALGRPVAFSAACDHAPFGAANVHTFRYRSIAWSAGRGVREQPAKHADAGQTGFAARRQDRRELRAGREDTLVRRAGRAGGA